MLNIERKSGRGWRVGGFGGASGRVGDGEKTSGRGKGGGGEGGRGGLGS